MIFKRLSQAFLFFLTSLFINQMTAFPCSYARLYRPSDGKCVDLIGDCHVPIAKPELTESEGKKKMDPDMIVSEDPRPEIIKSETILLEVFKNLSMKSQDKKTKILWEYNKSTLEENDENYFLRKAYREIQSHLQEKEGALTELINADNRPFEFALAVGAAMLAHHSFKSLMSVPESLNRYKVRDLKIAVGKALQELEAETSHNPVTLKTYQINEVQKSWESVWSECFEGHEELSLLEIGAQLNKSQIMKFVGDDFFIKMMDIKVLNTIFASQDQAIVYAGALHTKNIASELLQHGFIEVIKHGEVGINIADLNPFQILEKTPQLHLEREWQNLLVDPKDSYEAYIKRNNQPSTFLGKIKEIFSGKGKAPIKYT